MERKRVGPGTGVAAPKRLPSFQTRNAGKSERKCPQAGACGPHLLVAKVVGRLEEPTPNTRSSRAASPGDGASGFPKPHVLCCPRGPRWLDRPPLRCRRLDPGQGPQRPTQRCGIAGVGSVPAGNCPSGGGGSHVTACRGPPSPGVAWGRGRGRGAGLAALALGVLPVPGWASMTSPLFWFVPKLDGGRFQCRASQP